MSGNILQLKPVETAVSFAYFGVFGVKGGLFWIKYEENAIYRECEYLIGNWCASDQLWAV